MEGSFLSGAICRCRGGEDGLDDFLILCCLPILGFRYRGLVAALEM